MYLQIPVVYRAAAVSGLRRFLAGVEKSAEFAVEAGPRHNKLHSYQTGRTAIQIQSLTKEELTVVLIHSTESPHHFYVFKSQNWTNLSDYTQYFYDLKKKYIYYIMFLK